jgi:hypothetical protein
MKRLLAICVFVFSVILCPIFIFAQWRDEPVKPIIINSNVTMDESLTVFVKSGEKIFHKENCKLLSGGRTGMALRSARERGFEPCPECFPPIVTKAAQGVPGFDWKFTLLQHIGAKNLAFSDSLIDIYFIINKTQIGMAIQNKSDSAIKINWDEISFISPSNRASRVIHSGIRLMDKNDPQAPTTIPPKSNISDIIIPSENITYKDTWNEGRLFDGDYLSYNGKEFGVYLPLETRGTKKEYSFKFKISVLLIAPEEK